jgi:hypothetical protein
MNERPTPETDSRLEHLRKIDAHLEKLLSQAEKRTPGRWIRERYVIKQPGGRVCADVGPHHTPPNEYPRSCQVADEQNGDFIASCAGNAEAGWEATRAAIADWLSLYKATEGYADGAPDASAHDKLCNEVASLCRTNLRHILAAFPLELIKT